MRNCFFCWHLKCAKKNTLFLRSYKMLENVSFKDKKKTN